MKVLLTSTSFQDTPGRHQTLLANQGFEITNLRGPLTDDVLLDVIGDYDAVICGDDDFTRKVIQKGVSGRLRAISKYGIGLDKIDLKAAEEFNIPVSNCVGVNQNTVAEHVFALLLSYVKNIIPENNYLKQQKWVRLIGNEIHGKVIGIAGLGSIGKEIAIRASAFGLKIYAFDKFEDHIFAIKYGLVYCKTIEELFSKSDILSLNLSLNSETEHIINTSNLAILNPGVIIINTARAGLIEESSVLKGIESGIIKAYLTDVLNEEPMIKDHPFLNYDNIIITPHIGSRTYESVERQGTMAVENLLRLINNKSLYK